MGSADGRGAPGREQLLHHLYEASDLEHNLMCTYLYAAFSLRDGKDEGLDEHEAEAVSRWRREIIAVAVEEMEHLTAVWNITSALGGAPRFGRANFPLDPGYLPAAMVVRLAPFCEETLQQFIFFERPKCVIEPVGTGFEPERLFARGNTATRLTPMSSDYDTVGEFYACLEQKLADFVDAVGEDAAFCGDPALQLTTFDAGLPHVGPVRCLKSARAAMDLIVRQGEGAAMDCELSHYRRFVAIREELRAVCARRPGFVPAWPAATNPVLRSPPRAAGRVWIQDPKAVAAVDLANAAYQLMLRLLAYAYGRAVPAADRGAVISLGTGLMRAMVPLGEYAARQSAGPAYPDCHAGVSFTTLRDASALPAGVAARRLFVERFAELAAAADALVNTDPGPRTQRAAEWFARLLASARQRLDPQRPEPGIETSQAPLAAATATDPAPAATTTADGVERVEGEALTLNFDGHRCIHARHCVTGAPTVFLANVEGPWIHPDAIPVERLVEIAHVCPSGAISYRRHDGQADEPAPPVNLASVREAGPYAFRAGLVLDGQPIGYRATLCRCGASHRKPFCDGSHHDVGFGASGEPVTGVAGAATDMLPVRDGPLQVRPEIDGPLVVGGNLEIVSGTGRMVGRVTAARLCRCGGSQSKPFCDNTHARIGFRSQEP